MDIGKLFKDAWGLFVKDVGPLIVGMLIASIVPAIAGVVLGFAVLGTGMGSLEASGRSDASGLSAFGWVMLAVGFSAILIVILFLSAPLYVGLLSGVVRRVRDGREMGYGDAFEGFHLFGRVIGASVLLTVVYLVVIAIPAAVIVAGAIAHLGVLVAFGVVVMIAAVVLYTYLIVAWVYVFPVMVDRGAEVLPSFRESRGLVHGAGWWWTFFVLFILQLAVGAAITAMNMIPFVGSVAMIVVYPFILTYVVAMYFQARGEGGLIDAVLAVPAAQQWMAPPGAPPPPYPPAVSGPATPMFAPPPPPGAVDVAAWRAAADPLAAQPPSPSGAGGGFHPAPVVAGSAAVDGGTGQLQKHCSQCGALIGGSEEYCQACALEVSGGEPAVAPAPTPADAVEPVLPHTPPVAPEPPEPPDAPQTGETR
jgi:hypothetical protein